MQVPKWPDFIVTRSEFNGVVVWSGHTDTGRPKTPVFVMKVTAPFIQNEADARIHLRRSLDDAFAQAHPNGCPGKRKAENSNPSA